MKRKIVSIVGLGYVGLPLAILAKKKGYEVIGVDINKEKVEKINERVMPFTDEHVQKELKKYPVNATNDISNISKASVVIICVPTPVFKDLSPDYGPVKSACSSVARYLKKGQLIVIESTVNPGTSEELMLPILESGSGLKCGKDFFLAHCPERINPGDKFWGVNNIPRVVGGFDKKSLALALKFYKSVIDAKIKPMASLKEAEAVKVVENSFRNVNIAFVNELARSFAKLGIDVVNVINGAATKPFSFWAHYPGCGIGGHCIPVDPHYLIDYAKRNGFNHEFLKLSCQINEEMPAYTVDLLGKKLSRITTAVLGLSYKPNVDDDRESPSYEIIEIIKRRGGKVKTYDPHLLKKSSASSLDDALDKADAVILAVGHDIFIKKLTPLLLKKHKIKIIIDGRNCLNKESFEKAGIVYKGIGR